MPGHIKLVKGAVDPDPTEFLWPSMDMKKEDQNKPYDPKKSCWFPLKEGGYAEGIIEATEGDKVMKSTSHGGEIRIVGIADNRVCQGVKSILIRSLLSHRWWFALMVRRKY